MENLSAHIYAILEKDTHAPEVCRPRITSILEGKTEKWVVHGGSIKGLIVPGANSHEARPLEPTQRPIIYPGGEGRLVIREGERIYLLRPFNSGLAFAEPCLQVTHAQRGVPVSFAVCGRKASGSVRISDKGILLTRPPAPPTALDDDADAKNIAARVADIARAGADYAAKVNAKRSRVDGLMGRIAKLEELIPAATAKVGKLEKKAAEVELRAQKPGSGMRLIGDRAAELVRLRTAITAQEEGLENAETELADLKEELERVRSERVEVPSLLAAILKLN